MGLELLTTWTPGSKRNIPRTRIPSTLVTIASLTESFHLVLSVRAGLGPAHNGKSTQALLPPLIYTPQTSLMSPGTAPQPPGSQAGEAKVTLPSALLYPHTSSHSFPCPAWLAPLPTSSPCFTGSLSPRDNSKLSSEGALIQAPNSGLHAV
jgi:hypothetical protein